MNKILGENITYTEGERYIHAYFSRPAGKKVRKGLVIVPEIWGINDHIKKEADSLASQGLAVIVPDIYASGAVNQVLTGSEIESMSVFSSKLDHDRLAEQGYLEKELSELPEEKRKDIEKVIKVFRNGILGYELFLELQKAAGYFNSGGYAAVKELKFISFPPAGLYPPILTQYYLEYLQNSICNKETLEAKLRQGNPVIPELHGLLKKGEERLYCIIPFKSIDISLFGMKSCCWLALIAGYNNAFLEEGLDLVEAWKSDAFERVRESIRDGSYRHCCLQACTEVRGGQSNLLTLGKLRESYPDIADYVEGKDRRYRGMPDYGIISMDTACNLSCPSCSRHLQPKMPRRIKSEVIGKLKTLGKSLKTLYFGGMGEPFFSPVYLDFIMNFRRSDFPAIEEITMTTNGLKLTPDLWSRLPADFKGLVSRVTVSIDGATKATYEENRRGGSFAVLLENLRFIKTLRERGEIKYLRLYVVYQANNYAEMPEMVDLARRYSCDEVFFERMVNWGSYEAGEYLQRDIGNPKHPEHGSFTAVRDTVLDYKRKYAIPKITFLA